MNKKLLFSAIIFCTNISYADTLIDTDFKTAKIKSVYLCEDISESEKICDLGGGSYQARIIRNMSETVRLPEYFGIKNNGKITKATGVKLQIESDDKNYNNMWFITGTFKPEEVKDAEYIISFNDINESSGYIPVLRLSDYNFSPDVAGDKNLTLTNISSKEIKKIEITENGKYVIASAGSSGLPLSVPSGGSFSLILHPSTCPDADVKTDIVTIKYEMEGNIIESKIIIEFPCNKQERDNLVRVHNLGIQIGNSTGFNLGKTEGFNQGNSTGFDLGLIAGNSTGYTSGFQAGNSTGYDIGYKAAMDIKKQRSRSSSLLNNKPSEAKPVG